MDCRQHVRRLFAACGLLVLLGYAGVHVAAQETDVMDERAALIAIVQLSKAQRFTEAYQKAKEWEFALIGEPEFDFYFGIAATEVGELAEAILAFDRLLIQNPNAVRARLEMARTYFLLADYTESRRQFERVLLSAPPAAVERRIRYYLDMLSAREKSRHTASSVILSARVGHSSNINSATTEDYTDPIPGLNVVVEAGQPEHTIAIDEEQQAIRGQYSDIDVRYQVTRPMTSKRAQFLTASYRRLAYQGEGDYNLDVLNVGVGYLFRAGTSQYRIPLSFQGVVLDGEMLRYSASLSMDVVRPVSAQWEWMNYGVVSIQRYKEDIERDTDLLLVGSGLGYAFPSRPVRVFGSVLIAEDHEREVASNGRTYGGIRLSGEYIMSAQGALYLNITSQLSTYHDAGFFEEIREDMFTEVTLGGRWKVSPHTLLSLEAGYTDNDSNTVIYDYKKSVVEVAVQYVVD